MDFLWTKQVTPPSFPKLDQDKSADVLIIGGGMAGILCAYQLQKRGVSYILAEANQIGQGITRGTTAVLTAQHDILYQNLIKKFGKEKTRLYLDANFRAVARFRSIAKDVACDFEDKPSVMFSLHNKELMQKEAEVVRALGFDVEYISETPLPFSVAGAVRFNNAAQFHPLKFLYGIAQGLNIYENTFVKKLDGTTAITQHGKIHAKKIIIATHYPFINSHGMYFMKLYQHRSYVIAFENAPQLGCTIEDVAENGIYLRNYRDLLLVGGGDHRTGKKGGGFNIPRAFAKRYFPNAKEKFIWSNQDCVSLDGVPYIGAYGKNLPNVYVASGFNLWGMTSSMIASEILTDMVLEKDNHFASVFAPDRSMLTGQLFANIGQTLLDYIFPTTKRCTHMGCALKWNPVEHSWDCPCHGSRFDAHGTVINNPAMDDMQ